ncbi:cell envelope integrity protein CreD [Algoriphagus sp. PAP.12]|uniref:cell envelope integrity protein CreD n=1 Tax=Algoriphagus sp. PAP.12 TaxID=2996678 RepID=UPI00227A5356|nr:cell envelope integrity protein CreD [Algoriphagus sp. PAP.12]
MERPSNNSAFKNFQDWISNSSSIKLLVIGFIVLILLIPQSYTTNLIVERQFRLEEAEHEIREKWSRDQTITGPFISLPYFELSEIETKDEKKVIKELNTAYFLPDQLEINGNLETESLHRGIFDVAVYTNKINFSAKFLPVTLEKLNILPENVQWDQASILIGISDLRGISGDTKLLVNNEELSPEPFTDFKTSQKGLLVSLALNPENNSDLIFSGTLDIKGSKDFFIAPVGKTTNLSLSGNWPNPSFQGEFLPESRNITETGFESSWKVLHFNRPFGQEFIGSIPNFESSTFGLSLVNPADQYQQSIRTTKYALLIIVLSFLSLFMMEILTKKSIHPVQYTLIGFALVLYYTLLIALSEHIGFGLAYLTATIATVGLLGLYAKTLFPKFKQTAIFTVILAVFYTFIFVIIKQQDFALLLGSIGLFVALATTMYISRKINWNNNSPALTQAS